MLYLDFSKIGWVAALRMGIGKDGRSARSVQMFRLIADGNAVHSVKIYSVN